MVIICYHYLVFEMASTQHKTHKKQHGIFRMHGQKNECHFRGARDEGNTVEDDAKSIDEFENYTNEECGG